MRQKRKIRILWRPYLKSTSYFILSAFIALSLLWVAVRAPKLIFNQKQQILTTQRGKLNRDIGKDFAEDPKSNGYCYHYIHFNVLFDYYLLLLDGK